MRIRKIVTPSGKHALQVVSQVNGKLVIHKHIGSYASEAERLEVLGQAQAFIRQSTGQATVWDRLEGISPADIAITRSQPLFLYQLLSGAYRAVGLAACSDGLLRDLVIARIYQPVSKLETTELLEEAFGKSYALKTVYRHLKQAIAAQVKSTWQTALINFARTQTTEGLRLVFYDLTTLYFESTIKEGLRNFGFSKEHRSQQTQVIVGLVVNAQGFPIYFDVFPGNWFEGHTFVPLVNSIRHLLCQPDLVVVSDAAMLAKVSLEELQSHGIGFVVGARLSRLPQESITAISTQLSSQDGARGEFTWQGFRLICHYSAARAAKDKSDRLRQIERAQAALTHPSHLVSRFRFVRTEGASAYALNQDLVTQAEKLAGIKGYITNTQLTSQTILDRYHDLWRVEQAFRLTKSDLAARPIFHRLDKTITAHLLIVFAALAVSRHLEIQTGMSIKSILKTARQLLTHEVINQRTGEISHIQTTILDPRVNANIQRLKALRY